MGNQKRVNLIVISILIILLTTTVSATIFEDRDVKEFFKPRDCSGFTGFFRCLFTQQAIIPQDYITTCSDFKSRLILTYNKLDKACSYGQSTDIGDIQPGYYANCVMGYLGYTSCHCTLYTIEEVKYKEMCLGQLPPPTCQNSNFCSGKSSGYSECVGTNQYVCEKQSNGCLTDISKPVTKGQCGVQCISNNDCSSGQTCSNYQCINDNVPPPITECDSNNWVTKCNDNNDCTIDSCDVSGKCSHLPITAGTCGQQTECQTNDDCKDSTKPVCYNNECVAKSSDGGDVGSACINDLECKGDLLCDATDKICITPKKSAFNGFTILLIIGILFILGLGYYILRRK